MNQSDEPKGFYHHESRAYVFTSSFSDPSVAIVQNGGSEKEVQFLVNTLKENGRKRFAIKRDDGSKEIVEIVSDASERSMTSLLMS